MAAWTPDLEAELSQLLKDWLKQQGRTQADLRRRLTAVIGVWRNHLTPTIQARAQRRLDQWFPLTR